MEEIILLWKEFSVSVDKVRATFKATLSSNFDGLVCDDQFMRVRFFSTISQEDQDAVAAYWAGISSQTFAPTMSDIVGEKIDDAQKFGNQLLIEFATENVLMGITQSGKTAAVTNYLHKLSHYVMTGSLCAALGEFDVIIADTNKDSLAPFITNDRMAVYRAKIASYLGI